MNSEKKKYMITIIVGTIIMLGGILAAALTDKTEQITQSGIITIGMVMIIVGVIKIRKKQKGPQKDELTRKIADRSASYSWVLTLFVLLVVYWLDYFEAVEFTVKSIIAITYVVMVATMIIFQKIFWKRGDVQ